MNRLRVFLLGGLLMGLATIAPARGDQAAEAALATIDRALNTLTQIQALIDSIQKRQQADAATGTSPVLPANRGTVVPIDLQSKANHPLINDLHESEGNNLKGVPQGEQKLAGLAFQIGPKMIRLRGAHAQ